MLYPKIYLKYILRYSKIYDLHTQGRAVTHKYASKGEEYYINQSINLAIDYWTLIENLPCSMFQG